MDQIFEGAPPPLSVVGGSRDPVGQVDVPEAVDLVVDGQLSQCRGALGSAYQSWQLAVIPRSSKSSAYGLGVILIRLAGMKPRHKAAQVAAVVDQLNSKLVGTFVAAGLQQLRSAHSHRDSESPASCQLIGNYFQWTGNFNVDGPKCRTLPSPQPSSKDHPRNRGAIWRPHPLQELGCRSMTLPTSSGKKSRRECPGWLEPIL